MAWTDAFAVALADRYRLEGELGHGGMATVYVAHDLRHHRKVAIKVLRADAIEPGGAERFLLEIRTMAGLHHPNILPLFDSGEVDGALFFVMPVVDGESLRQRMDRTGPLPIADAVRIAGQVASALDYAHRQHVIHRDIKPENILLQDDQALVADFGIALAAVTRADRLTHTGVSIGTPQYMSPEQALGERALDARSDIYALAATLYEALTGVVPFTATSHSAMVAKLMTEKPIPPSKHRRAVPKGIDDAVATAMEKDPADRFPTASAFHAALARAGVSTTRRRPSGAMLVGAAAAVIVAGAALYYYGSGRIRDALGVATKPHSIAALPFRFHTFGGDTTLVAAIADNMPQEILDALDNVPGLAVRVMPHDARFRNVVNARGVASELDADIILLGDVVLEGDSIRTTIRPYDVHRNEVLSPIVFKNAARNILALEAQVSQRVAEQLQLGQMSPVALTAGRRTQPINADAHEKFMEARWFTERRTCASFDSAVALYTAATRIDSTYAEAWAELAQTHNLRAAWTCGPRAETFLPARTAVTRALALDSNLAVAHTTLGFLHVFAEWDWPAAAREFTRSMQIDSMAPDTWLYRTWYYMATDHMDSARASVRRAKELDPTSSIIGTRIGTVLYMSDSLDAARAEVQEVLRHEPDFGPAVMQIASIQAMSHRCDAIDLHSPALERWTAVGRSDGPVAEAQCGDPADARAAVARWEQQRAQGKTVSPWQIAIVHAELGDRAKAFAWIRTAVSERDWQVSQIRVEPAFAPYRSDPEFRQIVEQLKPAAK